MKNSVRNETSLVLVIAAIFSGVAIPVLSGFLEPSQPPAVAAVRIGDPAENAAAAAKAASDERDRARESQRPARERPAQPAVPAPADDDGADDDGD